MLEIVEVRDFKKREFILETDTETEYPQQIKFQLLKDKVNMLDAIPMGTELTIHFNLQGRKWTNPEGKDVWFNSLNAWKYKAKEGKEPVTPETAKQDLTNAVEDRFGGEEMPF